MFAAKTELSVPAAFILGGLLIVYECWVGYSTLARWQWLRNRGSWITRWGNSLMSFPASRIGVMYGALTGMFFGVAMIGSAMHLELPEDSSYLLIGIMLWMIAGPLVVVRDYGLYLDSKDE